MRRLIPIIVLVLACVVPTAAQANQSDSPPHLSCGEIDGTFSDFPSGPQTVIAAAADAERGRPGRSRSATSRGIQRRFHRPLRIESRSAHSSRSASRVSASPDCFHRYDAVWETSGPQKLPWSGAW